MQGRFRHEVYCPAQPIIEPYYYRRVGSGSGDMGLRRDCCQGSSSALGAGQGANVGVEGVVGGRCGVLWIGTAATRSQVQHFKADSLMRVVCARVCVHVCMHVCVCVCVCVCLCVCVCV